MSDAPRLMLCTLVEEPFDDTNWLFEPKLDGLRVLCRVRGNRVELLSRNGKEQATAFPDIVQELRRSVRKPAELDGEIVCLDENGLSSFRMIQQRFHLTDPAIIARRVKEYPAYIYLFDVVKPGPLVERKEALEKLVKWSDRVRRTEGIVGRGKWLLKQMCKIGGEGIVGKRLDSAYEPRRSEKWVKIKCSRRQEFVIGGFTEGQGSRVAFGALLIGYYDESGKLKYAGKVGTGFDTKTLQDIGRRLKTLEQKTSPFDQGDIPRAKWVQPRLVAEIAFSEWTGAGRLRHPRFEGLRMDKKAKEVVREKAKNAARVSK